MPKIHDDVFGTLASRLTRIDVERTFRQAIDVTADDGLDHLRMELAAEGASPEIRHAVKVLRTVGLAGGVGIPDSNPVSDDALEWEYGAMDGSTPPHGTFRMVAEDMADAASVEVAQRISAQIAGAT